MARRHAGRRGRARDAIAVAMGAGSEAVGGRRCGPAKAGAWRAAAWRGVGRQTRAAAETRTAVRAASVGQNAVVVRHPPSVARRAVVVVNGGPGARGDRAARRSVAAAGRHPRLGAASYTAARRRVVGHARKAAAPRVAGYGAGRVRRRPVAAARAAL